MYYKFSMMLRKTIFISSSLFLIACTGSPGRDVGTVGGATVGGGIGAAVGNSFGNPIAGIAVGAATGGILGGIVGKEQDINKLNVEGQQETIKKQEQELDRQRKEIEDIQRQQHYNRRYIDVTSKPVPNQQPPSFSGYGQSGNSGDAPVAPDDDQYNSEGELNLESVPEIEKY